MRYWDIAFESDWKAGSAMTWQQRGVTIADDEPGRGRGRPLPRLSYTWHTFTPEWAQTVGIDDDAPRAPGRRARSKVTFEIEAIDDEQVKLTVIHDDLEPDGLLVGMISGGWPRVIANLKTLLETGEPLPDIRGRR